MTNDFCSHQFRPRSSMTYDVCSHQLRPRSSMTNDFCSHQFRPRSSTTYGVSPAHISSGPGPQLLTPRTISLGLVPQPRSPTPNVPPTKNDWDSLFFPMFDEYFNPSPSVVQPVLVASVQEPVVSTGTPSSTRIDQDAPSTSTSQTTQEEQSHVIPTSVEEDDHGIEVRVYLLLDIKPEG
ncbi:hypothetical protein Tco_1573895 [Tanacetum coccineum]